MYEEEDPEDDAVVETHPIIANLHAAAAADEVGTSCPRPPLRACHRRRLVPLFRDVASHPPNCAMACVAPRRKSAVSGVDATTRAVRALQRLTTTIRRPRRRTRTSRRTTRQCSVTMMQCRRILHLIPSIVAGAAGAAAIAIVPAH
jgi:hypothetical protein